MDLGVNVPESMLLSDVERDAIHAGIVSCNVRHVRIEVGWFLVEPVKGRYEWRVADKAVNGARAAGIEPLVMLAHPPGWGPTAEDFGRFAAAVAARYGALPYQIFNEQNTNGAWPNPNGADYTAYLRAAAPGIRAAGGLVVFGGLSPVINFWGFRESADFVADCYAAGVKGLFDVMAFHPYYWSAGPPGDFVFGVADRIRAVMAANGEDLPVWGTECGFSTTTAGHTQAEQRDYLAVQYGQALTRPWFERLYVYSCEDYSFGRPHDPAADQENYGIFDSTGVPKLAAAWVRSVAGPSEDWQPALNELMGA